jgi:sulfatase modifying factor 1
MRSRALGCLVLGLGRGLIACAPDAVIAIAPRDGGADTIISDAPVVCPTAHGPAMANLVDYCIDLTEVTKAQYADFLASAPLPTAQAPECRWNLDFEPNNKPTTVGGGDTSCDETANPDVNDATKFPSRPVVCVDWCDAAAYCAWAGKHLCGARGGGSDGVATDPTNTLNDANRSEWYGACVGPAGTLYPYGNTFDANACYTKDITVLDPVDVASVASCHGPAGSPHAAIYDLSGNVAEWTNACVPHAGDGRANSCMARGGWFKDGRAEAAACAVSKISGLNITWPRERTDNHIGFRCCH